MLTRARSEHERSRARAVAREVDYLQQRRRWRRNGAIAGGAVGAVLFALLFLRLGRGGGVPTRPKIRLSSTGLTVDGRPASLGEVVIACQKAGACNVVVTGDARQGDWEILLNALVTAHVPFYVH